MKLILPKLHLLALKDAKANEDDFRQYIHVINKHAVVQNGLCVVVDLREYIKKECDTEDDLDFSELDQIIDWMDGKSFKADFWKELTSMNFVSLYKEGLKIENIHFNKLLEYEDIPRDIQNLIENLRIGLKRIPNYTDRVAVYGSHVDKLNSIFKKEVKNDCFLFDFCGKEYSIKFQVQKQPHIFGLLPVDYNASCEITAFLDVIDFGKSLTEENY